MKYHEVDKSFFAVQNSSQPTTDLKINTLRIHTGTHIKPSPLEIAKHYTKSNTVIEEETSAGMGISIRKEDIGENGDGFEVDSLGHAEYLFLHNLISPSNFRDVYDFNNQPESTGHFITEKNKIPSPYLVRMQNIIAQRTRRGMGNYLIYHPDNDHLIIDEFKKLKLFIFHPTPNCPKDKFVCLYKGRNTTMDIDAAFFYSDLGNKKYLYEIQNRVDCLSNAMDYVEYLPLKGI